MNSRERYLQQSTTMGVQVIRLRRVDHKVV